ncbi:MAG: DbpA RNA binding domain-containing protein, partial [Bacteroides sp.]|nr:DbpA RNA binding domain-containing protein [Bacteroides sp.]
SKADIAGFLYKKGGLNKEDIGQIEVNPYYTLTAIKREKMKNMLNLVRGEKIKGINTIFEEAK